MRATRIIAAAVIVLAVVAGVAYATETRWWSDTNAAGFKLSNLPAPTQATNPMRLQDVAVGAGWLKSSALNGTITANATIPISDITGADAYADGILTGGVQLASLNSAAY